MDDDKDDKSIVEKTIAAVKDIATIASDAAKKAMEPEPLKPGEQIVAYMPMVNDGLLADPMPPFVLAPRRKKSTSKKVPKKSAKKAAKTTKKTAKRATAKKTKSAAGRKAVRKKKAPKKVAKKKKAKKSKR